MEGGLRKLLQGWRDEIMSCLAHAEAVIDFGEDEDDCNDQVYARVETRFDHVSDLVCIIISRSTSWVSA
jgi:tRNA U34 5-carboxymethylaminomethyl modifying GTPase MnmE/TrmE